MSAADGGLTNRRVGHKDVRWPVRRDVLCAIFNNLWFCSFRVQRGDAPNCVGSRQVREPCCGVPEPVH